MKITFKDGKVEDGVYGVYLAGDRCFFEKPNGERTTFDVENIEAIRENSYAEEDLECAIEDLAWYIKEQFVDCPLIFRNTELQNKLYKQVKEYRDE
jgi:hypothetical protein